VVPLDSRLRGNDNDLLIQTAHVDVARYGFDDKSPDRLPVTHPLTKEEIAAQEKDLERLRERLGLRRWCQLYAGEMEQARILVDVLRRQN